MELCVTKDYKYVFSDHSPSIATVQNEIISNGSNVLVCCSNDVRTEVCKT